MGARRRKSGVRRAIVFVLVLAAIVGGGIYALGLLLSPQFVVQRLQAAVQAHTGRTLTIGGKPAIQVFPRIAVTLPNVRLSNPPSFPKGDFAQVRRVELVMELWPLLQRELVLKKLHLVQPQIHLMVDAEGRNNWSFGAAGSGGNGGGLVERIRLAPITIERGVVLFDDARSGARHLVRDLDVVVQLSSPGSPLSVKGGAVWRGERVRLSLFVKRPAQLVEQGSPLEAFMEAAGAKLEYQGLAGFRDGLSLAGTLSASGPSLRGLLRWLGASLPAQGRGLGRFSLQGALEASKQTLTLQKLRLSLDDSNAQGSARIHMKDGATMITAALGVDKVATDTYLGPPPPQPQTGWSEAPVVPDLPRDLSADIRISVNNLHHRRLKMGPGAARFVVKNGAFSATLERMAFYGGGLKGNLSITPGGKAPQVAAEFHFDKVQARPFLSDLAEFRYLSGSLSGVLDVKATGRSPLEIVGSLRGLANLDFSEGKIHGVSLVKLMELVQKGIVQGWNFSENDTTDFVKLVAKFVIVDGIAGVRELSLRGPLVQASGKGEVDLLRQRLDLSLDGTLVQRQGDQETKLLRLPVPLLVKGVWQQPKIYPDIAGILKNPQAAMRKFQELMRLMGSRKPKLERAARKVKGAARKQATTLQDKATKALRKQLTKTLGKKEGGKAAAKVEKKAQKVLKSLLRKKKSSRPSSPPPQPKPKPGGQPASGPVQLVPLP